MNPDVPSIQVQPAGRGVTWVTSAFSIFRAYPLNWLVSALLFVAFQVVLQFVPLIGGFIVTLLSPVLVGGILLGCQRQAEGQDFEINALVAGFSCNTSELLMLGLLTALFEALILVLMLVVALVTLGGLDGVLKDLGAMEQHMVTGASPLGLLVPVLVGLVLALPLAAALWLSPALVALNGMRAWPAMHASLVACFANWAPFTLYGLVILPLAILASIPMLLGWLVLLPMLFAGIWLAWRDIFDAESAVPRES